MSLLSRLFGKSGTAGRNVAPVEHQGFLIFVEPQRDNGGFRVAARIEKEVDGETRSHLMIRADTFGSQEAAADASLFKAKVLIDQQGTSIFR